MISLEEARDLVLSRCAPLAPGRVPVAEALGLVLAEPVVAAENVPGFANTAMDGYAVRAADTTAAPVKLRVVATIAAGSRGDEPVGPGEAARIMTGAPIPPGADAVVMVERTTADGDVVEVDVEVPVGNHVRPVGDDVEAGTEVIGVGTVLEPGHLGVAASVGVSQVLAGARPRVGVVSTGDELVDDGTPLQRGQIRDSNRVILLAMLARAGFTPVDLGLVRDDMAAIRERMLQGARECDAVLTSGGVSVGDFDYVKVVLDEIGDMSWVQIAIRPAKPFAFGTVEGTPVFGLPGNPVSSMVSFELLAKPGLRAMAGHPEPVPALVPAVAGVDMVRKPDGKVHFMRVVSELDDGARRVVAPVSGQGSHMLHAMAGADALAVVPDGDGVSAGDPVGLVLLDS